MGSFVVDIAIRVGNGSGVEENLINGQVQDVLKIEGERFKNYTFDLVINRWQMKTERKE